AGWAPSTLVRAPDGGAVSIERFIAYPSRQATGDISYSVVVETVDFRCADHLMKTRDSVFYSNTLEPNGNGYAEDWTATPQSGPDAVLNAVACAGARMDGARSAADLMPALRNALAMARGG
ncbi:MAG: hypothetical protein R3C52_16070, partial [Hyphomonadaceae bacterium]